MKSVDTGYGFLYCCLNYNFCCMRDSLQPSLEESQRCLNISLLRLSTFHEKFQFITEPNSWQESWSKMSNTFKAATPWPFWLINWYHEDSVEKFLLRFITFFDNIKFHHLWVSRRMYKKTLKSNEKKNKAQIIFDVRANLKILSKEQKKESWCFKMMLWHLNLHLNLNKIWGIQQYLWFKALSPYKA